MDRLLAAPEGPIDLAHLAEQTLGDEQLQRELLKLFAEQSPPLLTQMQDLGPNEGSALDDLVHRLKGSARAIGAVHVSDAAEAIERRRPDEDRRKLLAALAAALEDSMAAIEDRLRLLPKPALPSADPPIPRRDYGEDDADIGMSLD
jgi:HPt (histidine-containing phosphotransfer) domain-containing protein